MTESKNDDTNAMNYVDDADEDEANEKIVIEKLDEYYLLKKKYETTYHNKQLSKILGSDF